MRGFWRACRRNGRILPTGMLCGNNNGNISKAGFYSWTPVDANIHNIQKLKRCYLWRHTDIIDWDIYGVDTNTPSSSDLASVCGTKERQRGGIHVCQVESKTSPHISLHLFSQCCLVLKVWVF